MSEHRPGLIPYLLRCLLAAVLALSGLGKLLDASAAIKVFELVTEQNSGLASLAPWAIAALSLAELALAAWLLTPRRPRLALSVLSGVWVFFILTLVSLPLRGIEVPACGCFGALLPDGSPAVAIVRNFGLLALTLAAHLFTEPSSRTRHDGNEMAARIRVWSRTLLDKPP